MKEIDLDKYKSAWAGEDGFKTEIEPGLDPSGYLNKRSKGILGSFKSGLAIDIVLKIMLGVSFVTLVFLYSNQTAIVVVCSLLLALICYLLILQFKSYSEIPAQVDYSDDLRTFLEKGIAFYRTRYIRSLYLAALSSPLFFLSGMFFYNYYKYSGIRTMDITDFAVLGIFCLVGFVFSAFAYIKQFDIRIVQMEKCLSELDEGGISELTIRKQMRQQRTLLILSVLLLIAGFAVMAIILML